jgi:hypothetical protein
MSPRTAVLLVSLLGLMLASQPCLQAQGEVTHGPSSLARIRAALGRAPAIDWAPAPAGHVPTFRIDVHQTVPILPLVDEEPFDPTYGLPSAGELLMGGIGKLHAAVVNARRGRARRRARKEVEDALAAFCAVHDCRAPAAGR